MKDLLRIADLAPEEFAALLRLAAEVKRDPYRHDDFLRGDVVAMYFAKPSTRTRFSFETAIHRLGGSAVAVGPADLQLGRGETIEDTARTLSHFAAALVIRTFSDLELVRFAEAAAIPVVNALTDGHHPCQALADFLTLQERFGSLRDIKLAYCGDGNNVAHSLMEAAALTGLDFAIAHPPGYAPDETVVERARDIARSTEASILVTTDVGRALDGAAAVYTDTWISMGTPESEREARRKAFEPYQVNEELLSLALPGAVFMHCLPAHRWDEVTPDVVDGPRSVIWEQVENRGHTEQAVLLTLIGQQRGGFVPGTRGE